MTKMIKSYSELISIDSYLDRYEYLKIGGIVGNETFGSNRYLNQAFYNSQEWRSFRREVITRDLGRDMAFDGRDIFGKIYIHHINPITEEDLIERNPIVLDLENAVCVARRTHEAIHYGDISLLSLDPITRCKNDTIPWR